MLTTNSHKTHTWKTTAQKFSHLSRKLYTNLTIAESERRQQFENYRSNRNGLILVP